MRRNSGLSWSPGAAGALLEAEDRAGLRWRAAAECATVDPEIFFPEPGRKDQAEAARRVCAGCPVQPECLEFALSAGVGHGIWGGLTAEERRGPDPSVVALALVPYGDAEPRLCGKGLHEMTAANTYGRGRCRECRLAFNRSRTRSLEPSRARKGLAA